MNPHARSINTFRQQFRWQRRSHCLWLIGAFAGPAIPLEAFRFELSDFGLRLIQFALQLRIPLNRPSMHTLPVSSFTPQFGILSTQLHHITTQLFHQSL